MTIESVRELPLDTQDDVVRVRQAVRAQAVEIGFNIVDQTKAVTAASELARNTVIHGGGGSARIEVLQDTGRRGLRLSFEDKGPGIPDLDAAMKDGFTTGTGLGLGLGGSRRLASEFSVQTGPGEGTRVVYIRWRG